MTHLLRTEYLLEIDDIAAELQKSKQKIKKRLQDYELFREYVEDQGDSNPQQFTYFKEISDKIRNWILEDEINKKNYFALISPTSGRQKIRGAAYGLKDFKKVFEDPEALEALINNPNVQMEHALEIVKQNDVFKAMPFLTRIQSFTKNLLVLSDEEIEQIAKQVQVKTDLKKLQRACENLLEKL